MTAVRKVVDSNVLSEIFDLPSSFKNKQVEVILFPVDKGSSSVSRKIPLFTMAQIDEWAKAPEIQDLTGILKEANLPADISISDIRNARLAGKYKI